MHGAWLSVRNRREKWAAHRISWLIVFAALFGWSAQVAWAQRVTTALATGMHPFGVAANHVTNKIYVANESSNNVTVIDGATNSTRTVTVATSPLSVAVNLPSTRFISRTLPRTRRDKVCERTAKKCGASPCTANS